jgi:type IV pilus assembly protein PilY1
MNNRHTPPRRLAATLEVLRAVRQAVGAALLGLAATASQAAPADLASAPLAQAANGEVRANIMFVLDDSGSMAFNYMPDSANTNNLCEGYHGVNKIFFNPAVTYFPPLYSNGSSYPDASFTLAYDNGYAQSGTQTNLNQVSNLNTPSTRVGGTNATPTLSKFYYATYKIGANPATPVCSGNSYDWAKWDIVTSAASWTAAQKTNYANWYSYYRTRVMTMRAGTGRAFAGLNDQKVRVGFSTITSTSVSDGTSFLNVRDLDSGTQKADFFSRLYGVSVGGYTPLRPPLVKSGKYFANKAPSQSYDPAQYSCQRNYTILSTDGQWNTNDEPSNFVPTRLDGTTAIGNQDSGSGVARPKRDECTPTTNTSDVDGCTNALGSGVSNSLADIAKYFYDTDLRDPGLSNCTGSVSGENVCTNKPDDGSPSIKHQNMVTYTIGLGVNGILNYRSDYKTATSGDYYDITQGNKVWPNPITDSSDSRYNNTTIDTRIDDLWHAAVNGGGIYFSATNALELSSSLTRAFAEIDSRSAGGSAASTSSLRPTSGDDWLFFSLYTTVKWTGDLRAHKIDLATGAVINPNTPIWNAAARIDAQGSRNVYFHAPGQTDNRATFTYANLSAPQKALFDNMCLAGSERLSQCGTFNGTQTANVTGTNLVDYLRGVRSYEMSSGTSNNRVFRTRETVLGDIVNASPVYVKKSPFKYTDAGHNTFVTSTASRTAVVYVAANDGMLHAINVGADPSDSTGGTELWAYVPSTAMPNMHKLADANYGNLHQYFVDATPVVGDVYDSASSSWKTILVGGMGGGGRGYYALDITTPTSPKVLWELTKDIDNDIGFSFGNPVITKNKAGKWVVAFSSGYNNVSPGSGNGQLFVVDALTGSLNNTRTAFDSADPSFRKLPTNVSGSPVGSASTPNNVGKINSWVDADTNNTTKYFYAGDMLGNVWRFDFDDNVTPSGNEAFRLGYAGSNQPITTKPQLSVVKVGTSLVPVVTVATGRLLGLSDITDNSTQSVYVFKDALNATPIGSLRSSANAMVQQTLGANRLVAAPATVDWTTQNGWFVDLNITAGERVNVDFLNQFNQLVIASNVPAPSPCTPGGTSWLYYFDLATGSVVLTYYTESLTVGLSIVKLPNGKLITHQQGSWDKPPVARENPIVSGGAATTTRRISWRELIN